MANGFHAPYDADDRAVSALRGAARARGTARRAFGDGDLRDLQVWHKLAWMDPDLLVERSAPGRAGRTRAATYTEDDKATLRAVELELLARVVPAYRDAGARGQVELSTSPFYHPILPLLCDSDVHLRAHPQAARPRARFARPEDARRADRARDRVSRGGVRAAGRAACGRRKARCRTRRVRLIAEAGCQWIATDEDILARSLGRADAAGRCCTGRTASAPRGPVRAVSRSRAVGSDRLPLPVVGRRRRRPTISSAASARPAGASPRPPAGKSATVVGDPRRRERLGALRGRRPSVPARAVSARSRRATDIQTVTMAEAAAGPATPLPSIFPGLVDQRRLLHLDRPSRRPSRLGSAVGGARGVRRARRRWSTAARGTGRCEEILIAEGSDWFWWYGDDHSSDHDREFDELFRRHLRNVYARARRAGSRGAVRHATSAPARAPDRLAPSGFADRDARRPGHRLLRVGRGGVAVAGQARRRDARGRGPGARSPRSRSAVSRDALCLRLEGSGLDLGGHGRRRPWR